MKMDKKVNRLRFCVGVCRDMIDGSERAIEHHKSKIKTSKEQIKGLIREIDMEILQAGVGRLSKVGTTGTVMDERDIEAERMIRAGDFYDADCNDGETYD